MNKSKSILLFAGFFGLLLAGCQAYDEETTMKSINGLTIKYAAPNMVHQNPGGVTRANTGSVIAAVGDEAKVNTLRLFFFEPSADGSGLFIESYTVPEGQLGTPSGTVNVEFAPGSKLIKSNAYVILAVANAPVSLYNNVDAGFANMSETDFTMGMQFEVEGSHDEDNPQYDINYPITQAAIVMSQRIDKAASAETLDLALNRIVSRIDVQMSAPGYTLASASIWNAADRATIWETSTGISPAHTQRFYGINVDPGESVLGGLYALPNYSAAPTQIDDVTTCLILGIAPYHDTDGDGKGDKVSTDSVFYYRVNISNENMQNLRRNTAYSIRVLSLKGWGATSEKDALTQPELLLNITTNYWNVEGTVSMDEYGNLLAIGTPNLQIPAAGGLFNVQIYTVNTGITNPTLRVRTSRLPVGMDFRLTGNVLEITSDSSAVDRTGFVELEYGTLSGTVNITQTAVVNKYLEITPATMDIFGGNAGERSPKFSIASSGPWTAVLNNPGFSFNVPGSALQDTLRGDNMDQNYVYTYTSNDGVQPRAAFIYVTLDSDPEIARVLVLRQRGVGGIDVKSDANMDVTSLDFKQNGVLNTPNFQYFVVTTDQTSENDEWEIVKSGANPDKFRAMTIDKTTEITEGGPATITQFTIVADSNKTASNYTATIRIQLKGRTSIGRDIAVTQNAHTVSFNPTASTGNIALAGGTETFTITSSNPWKATIRTMDGNKTPNVLITDSANIATLDKYEGVTGDVITLTFPENRTPLIVPTAIITVTVDGSNVSKEITVRQSQLNPRAISVRQHYQGHQQGLRPVNRGADSKIAYDIFTNSAYFGPTGTVYTMQPLSVTDADRMVNPILGHEGIYWEQVAYDPPHTNNAIAWKSGNPMNFVVFMTSYYDNMGENFARNITGDASYTFNSESWIPEGTALSPSTGQTWCAANGNRGAKIWEYLLKTGPFTGGTELNVNAINFIKQDFYYGNQGFMAWPTTMVPLIVYNGKCTVGIDLTRNFAIVHNALFNDDNRAGLGAPTVPTPGSDSYKFVQNLLALIVNAAQFGTDFTDQFKD
ncbi:MAG: hypothetical protein LBM62_02000 [Mediterranea sp.]|jgi:hypothetical protein|nr:hypothetical protein [Mediterranea sp.]